MVKNKRVGVISLGCDKNRVDTEKMLAILSERHVVTPDIEKTQILIINTCAFLESSRKEAIDEILSAVSLKADAKSNAHLSATKDAPINADGGLEKIIVTGCLPQKFVGELIDCLPEVDAFMGVSDYARINEVIDQIYLDKRLNAVGAPCGEPTTKRVVSTPHYAYLKVADGCSNHCTYCLIPYIRGRYRSVPLDDLVTEAKALGDVAELILVAQDTTSYGQERGDGTNLCTLIRALSALDNVKKIRLLYCYPENITEELIDQLACNPKLIKYIDIPFQHADDKVLKLMNRKGTGERYLSLIDKLKRRVSGIAIRSTFITGFPQETDEAFQNLLDFIGKARLFNAGFFKYSREAGTPAYKLVGQIPAAVKTARLKKLYAAQKKVVKQNYKELIGKTVSVLAEGFDSDGLVYYGRAYFNAPDVDGKVYFFSADEVEYGKEVEVKIIKATGYDLYGERV